MEAALKNFIVEHRRVYIFGIGNYSAALAERLHALELDFNGFIATSKTTPDQFTQSPVENFMDKSVHLVGEVDGAVILALPEKYQSAAERLLRESGVENILRCSDEYMLENVRRANELTVELVDEFKRSSPFPTVERRPWREILVVCLGGIGDMILTTPFLQELKRNHPLGSITLITTPISLELMEKIPFVECVRAFDWKQNIGTLRERMERCRRFIDELRRERSIETFDAAFLLSWGSDLYGASFLIFFSRAARRIGYSEHVTHLKENSNRNYDLLFSETIDDRSLRHDAERGLVLLARLGDSVTNRLPELYSTREDHSTVDRLLKESLDSEVNLIVLGVSATAPHRIWARENFAALVNRLHEWCSDLRFVILGASDAVDIAAFIVEHSPRGIVLDFTERLTLRESAALCTRALLYVGNNTGTMHLAAACGLRCVEINSVPLDSTSSYSDNAVRTRPFGVEHIVLAPKHTLDDCVGHCSKAFAHCINQIAVDEVFEAVRKFFDVRRPHISIIVPVYNVEDYLPRCLESILRQTYEDFELLLIDDGSTDRSGKILDEYAARDRRLRVFHKANGGASSARNVGLKHSTGAFITYIDSDDWVEPDYLENLIAPFCSERGDEIDIVIGQFRRPVKEGFLSPTEALLEIFAHGGSAGSLWTKAYRRDLFVGFKHFVGNTMSEDSLDNWELFARTKRIYSTSVFGYHYTVRADSYIHTPDPARFTLEEQAFHHIYRDARTRALDHSIIEAAKTRVLSTYFNAIRNLINGGEAYRGKLAEFYATETDDIHEAIDTLECEFLREMLTQMITNGVDGIYAYYSTTLNELHRRSERGGKIYVYGAGYVASFVADILDGAGIDCEAYLVSAGREPKLTGGIINVVLPVRNMDRIERSARNAIVMGVSLDVMNVILPELVADGLEEVFII